MMSESLRTRIERLEALHELPGEDLSAQRRELRGLFAAGDPGNAEIFACCAAQHGTRDIAKLLRRDDSGALRRRVGLFCQQERLRFPGAEIVKVRCVPGHCRALVAPQENGLFLQIIEVCDE
jgi:hypothetical protein